MAETGDVPKSKDAEDPAKKFDAFIQEQLRKEASELSGRPVVTPEPVRTEEKKPDEKPSAADTHNPSRGIPKDFPGVQITDSKGDKADSRPPSIERAADRSQFTLADGTYHRDEKGRVSKTVSTDGTVTRDFKFNDSANPKSVTSFTINGNTEFTRTGPESFAITKKDADGRPQPIGTYPGNVSISDSGLLAMKGASEAVPHYRGAEARDLTAAQVQAREQALLKLQPKDIAPPERDLPRPERVTPKATVTAVDDRKVTLDDGTYKRDAQGRVTEMISADGKNKRAFKYEDTANPSRVTSEIINDKTTYKYIGQVTSEGKPYKIDGMESNSYSIYENGQLIGNWSGVRSVSANGVYSHGESADKLTHSGASGRLSEAERTQRNQNGIWPSQVETTHADGTKYIANLKGNRLDKLTETKIVDGKPIDTDWKKDGAGRWFSDDFPPKQRMGMEMGRDGNLRYQDVDGTSNVKYRDGGRDVVNQGVTRRYDLNDRLKVVTQLNGDSRTLEYTGSELTSITDRTKLGTRTSSRAAGSDEWQSNGKTEVRKDLRLSPDGSIDYKLESGNRVRQTRDFARVEFDDRNRPIKVDFENGSNRKFNYEGDKLKSITDTLISKDKQMTKLWTRDGNTDNFVNTSGAKPRVRVVSDPPTGDGDYKYKGDDGKERTAFARDVARGDLLSNSETVQEAREELVRVAQEKGVNTPRFESYLNDFEKNAGKYGLKPEQMAKTMDHLREILTADKSPLYNSSQLKQLVETAMHNIARPMEIDQGYHPTCNVATVEVYAAARHPDEYARMCKEIALSGKYRTNDGKVVTPPRAALLPGEDESSYDLDKPNVEKRNFASQIVQMTLINGMFELDRVISNGSVVKDTRYIMGKITWQPGPNNSQRKIGEDRLVDLQGRPKKNDDEGGPGFAQDNVLASSEMMLGYKMPYVVQPKSYDNGRTWKYDLPTADRLIQAKANSKLPMGVPTMGGTHVQTIHDVKMENQQCWVLLDNQHGEKNDGWVTLEDLHRTQQTRGYEISPAIRRWESPRR